MTIDEIKEYREKECEKAAKERELLVWLAERSRNMSQAEIAERQYKQAINQQSPPYHHLFYEGHSASIAEGLFGGLF